MGQVAGVSIVNRKTANMKREMPSTHQPVSIYKLAVQKPFISFITSINLSTISQAAAQKPWLTRSRLHRD